MVDIIPYPIDHGLLKKFRIDPKSVCVLAEHDEWEALYYPPQPHVVSWFFNSDHCIRTALNDWSTPDNILDKYKRTYGQRLRRSHHKFYGPDESIGLLSAMKDWMCDDSQRIAGITPPTTW